MGDRCLPDEQWSPVGKPTCTGARGCAQGPRYGLASLLGLVALLWRGEEAFTNLHGWDRPAWNSLAAVRTAAVSKHQSPLGFVVLLPVNLFFIEGWMFASVYSIYPTFPLWKLLHRKSHSSDRRKIELCPYAGFSHRPVTHTHSICNSLAVSAKSVFFTSLHNKTRSTDFFIPMQRCCT